MILPKAIEAYRNQYNLSTRRAAKLIGIDHTVLWRFEQGQDISGGHWNRIVLWLLAGDHKQTEQFKKLR